jgi:hypothetical protein
MTTTRVATTVAVAGFTGTGGDSRVEVGPAGPASTHPGATNIVVGLQGYPKGEGDGPFAP